MIRPLHPEETEVILAIINVAAQAYCGVIPGDCWHEPYMSRQELESELRAGVNFWGYEGEGRLVGVMGRQVLGEVTLIRHAYVDPAWQRRGIGKKLLHHLLAELSGPVLVGTWADAHWAVAFYEKNGFILVTPQEKERLLRTYWTISDRQVETSVVLARGLEKAEVYESLLHHLPIHLGINSVILSVAKDLSGFFSRFASSE